VALASCYSLRENSHKVPASIEFLTIENPEASAEKLAGLAAQQLQGGQGDTDEKDQRLEPRVISNEKLVSMLINVRVVYALHLALRIVKVPGSKTNVNFCDDVGPLQVRFALTSILAAPHFINQAESSFLKMIQGQGDSSASAQVGSWSSYWTNMIRNVIVTGTVQDLVVEIKIKKEPDSETHSSTSTTTAHMASTSDIISFSELFRFDNSGSDSSAVGGRGLNVMDILCVQDALQQYFKSYAMLRF
jgi:hypothetical protein